MRGCCAVRSSKACWSRRSAPAAAWPARPAERLLLARTLPPDSLPPHAVIALSPAVLAFAVAIATLAAVVGHVGARLAAGPRRRRRRAAADAHGRRQPRKQPGAGDAGRRGSDPGVCACRRGDALRAHASCTCSTSTSGSCPTGWWPSACRSMAPTSPLPRRARHSSRRWSPSVAALPGVSSVSAINHLPLAGDLWTLGYAVEGRPPAAPGEEDGAAYRVVLPRYFATVGQAIRAGRDFTSADRAGSVPVVIVNQHLADRQWPGQSALGRRLRFGDDLLTVVGVVADVPQATLVEPIDDEMYLPLAQRPTAVSHALADDAGRAHRDRCADVPCPARRRLEPGSPGCRLRRDDAGRRARRRDLARAARRARRRHLRRRGAAAGRRRHLECGALRGDAPLARVRRAAGPGRHTRRMS